MRELHTPKNEGIRYTSVSGGRTVLTEQIRLLVVLSVTGLVLLALETTVFGRIRLPIGHMGEASPSLGLLFCMAVGFLHGERVGGIAGLLCGWMADSVSIGVGGNGDPVAAMMLLPLLYFLCGYLSGTVGKRRLAHNLPSFVVFAAGGGALECLFLVARIFLIRRTLPPLSWIMSGLLPMWILTVFFSPAIYGIVWLEWGKEK